MSTDEISTAFSKHHAVGIRKHRKFPNAGYALTVIADRIDRLTAAVGSIADPDQNEHIARRLLQLGGLCIRAMLDLGLPIVTPRTNESQTADDTRHADAD